MSSVEVNPNLLAPEVFDGGQIKPETRSAFNQLIRDLPDAVKVAGRVFRGKPIGFSFNVADRCPINCDCYWRAMDRVPELSPDEMVDFFEARREEGYVHANMVGGEPYVHLNSDLLERLAETMPSSWITTSGVTRMKHIPNVLHFVSVDGGDAETHDRVRGFKGLHAKIIKNLSEARATGFFPAALHVTLNSQNYHQIPQILETWGGSGLVDGVAFSTHTSITDANDEHLRPSDEQKLHIVAELLRQKKQHGSFLLNTEAMTRRLSPEVMKEQTPETCATAKFISSFHADGSKIEQCIFTEKGDCSTCGCAVTLAINNTASVRRFDWETTRMLRGLMPPYKQAATTIKLADLETHPKTELQS
jgi:MoaA/NifB/PqqE/SkfB family radical SAM enzyme